MADQKLFIPRWQDKKILDCFKDIARHFSGKSVTCSISMIGYITYQEDLSHEEYSETTQNMISQNSVLIEHITLNVSGFSVVLYRGGQQEPKSPIYDELVFNRSNQSQLENDDKFQLVTEISKQLKPFDPKLQISGLTTPEQKALQALHQQTLERLESLNEELIRKTHAYREKLEKDYTAKRDALQTDFSVHQKSLEKEYSEKVEKLEKDRQTLEELRKSLDDRSNTHVRREIRRDILKEVKSRAEKFQLTKDTRKLRIPIAVSMLTLIILLGTGAIYAFIEFFQKLGTAESKLLIVLGLRQIAFAFGAVGSLIYFIKWLNKWFEEHAQAEFQIRQFQLDIERASWIVETSLEWNDAKGTTIPEKLVESLSRNLFSEKTSTDSEVVHPADQLASALIGTASSIKLKVGDSEININPKKLIKTKMGSSTDNSN